MTDKLQELILYIADRCEDEEEFGSTKLNKILFFADFTAYARTGHAITGEQYQKLEHGPAPRRLLPAIDALKRENALAEKTRGYYGYPQRWYVALRDPDLTQFTAEDIAIVDEVVDRLRGKTGADVSHLSHTFVGWRAAKMNEDIPYETAWISSAPLSEEAEALAETVAKRCFQTGE